MSRQKKCWLVLLVLLVFLKVQATGVAQGLNYQFGIKPAVSQATMYQQVTTAFLDWEGRYVTHEGCPPGTYRVHCGEVYDFQTVSEGIGWGMLFMVLLGDGSDQSREYFDGFWRYYQHYAGPTGLMSWKISARGEVLGSDAATEADENVAMALLYAAKKWPAGEINYAQAAEGLIGKILSYEVEPRTYVLKPGTAWGGSSNINPAYFDSAYYRGWASFDKKWSRVAARAEQTYEIFYEKYQTGLLPDWCNIKGQPTHLSFDYTYDACQVSLKIGLDFLWYGQNKKYVDRLTKWIKKQTGNDPEKIVDAYRLDGQAIGHYHNAAFVGPLAVAAMCSDRHQEWLSKLYNHLVAMETGGRWGYYQDTLRLMSLIVLAGNMPLEP